MSGNDKNSKNAADTANGGDPNISSVDFSSLSTSALVSYIDYHGLAKRYPFVADPSPHPSPSPSASNRSSPLREDLSPEEDEEERRRAQEENYLVEVSGKRRAALASAAATSTSYNSKEGKFHTRSPPATYTTLPSGGTKRKAGPAVEDLNEGEEGSPPPKDFFDDEDAKSYLAKVAREHFDAQSAPKEGEVVVGFLYRCRTKDKCLKIAEAPS
ncbi:unnamed protein product [Sympodiomycopsis kandeliae]